MFLSSKLSAKEHEIEKYRTSIFFFPHQYLLALAVNKSLKKNRGSVNRLLYS